VTHKSNHDGLSVELMFENPSSLSYSVYEFQVAPLTGCYESQDEACRQINEWQKAGFNVPCISVNVSPRQFEEPGFPEFIQGTLEKYSVKAELLGIDITENLFMESTLKIENNLHALHKMGCKISLDDFGTGYSAMSYLLRFPIDVIKIDQRGC